MNRPVDRSATWAPTGTAKRQQQTAEVVRRYTAERQSIRVISAALGWSYGKTYRLLSESGTRMRPRGGAHRKGVPTVRDVLPVAEPSS